MEGWLRSAADALEQERRLSTNFGEERARRMIIMINPAFAIFMVWRLYAQGQKSDFVAARSSVAPLPPRIWNLPGRIG